MSIQHLANSDSDISSQLQFRSFPRASQQASLYPQKCSKTATNKMFEPAPQTLTTLRPTPSTVLFTVSTRPVAKTLPALFSHYISLLLKFFAGTFALLALWTKWRVSNSQSTAILGRVLGGPVEEWIVRDTARVGWRYIGPVALAVLWVVVRRGYTGWYYFLARNQINNLR